MTTGEFIDAIFNFVTVNVWGIFFALLLVGAAFVWFGGYMIYIRYPHYACEEFRHESFHAMVRADGTLQKNDSQINDLRDIFDDAQEEI